MRSNEIDHCETSRIYVGVDVHVSSWHLTVRTDDVVLGRAAIGGSWEELRKVLSRWPSKRVTVIYEAGFSGFWLYDAVVAWGGQCLVVAPSRIPVESGNRIKTDRRDSAKLAHLAAAGELVSVWVPSMQERQDREVVRERRRIMRQLRQVQCQIKALLHCYGVVVPSRAGRWSLAYEAQLRGLRMGHELMEASFTCLLDRYRFLREQCTAQTRLIRGLASQERYREKMMWLTSLPGVGPLTAMELLTELCEVSRFGRAEEVAAYCGLTPSEYSSGARVRRGHISRCGKAAVRSRLVEAAWVAIRFDPELRGTYERLRARRRGCPTPSVTDTTRFIRWPGLRGGAGCLRRSR